MIIFGFNGPPRSGKDTCANLLHGMDDRSKIYDLAGPLKDGLCVLLNITREKLERDKDAPIFASGTSYRDMLIEISERVIKPKMGNSWWACRRIDDILADRCQFAIISDIGFQEEVNALEHFGTFILCKVVRPGYDWKNDSRSYVKASITFTIENDADLAHLSHQLNFILKSL